MSTYALKNSFYLYKDDVMTVCPIANAIPFPKPQKQQSRLSRIDGAPQMEFELKRFPCTAKCPHFEITEKTDEQGQKVYFTLHCSAAPFTHELTIEGLEIKKVDNSETDNPLKITKK